MWQTKYASAVPMIWDWDLIFGRAVKAISSPGIRSLWKCQLLKGVIKDDFLEDILVFLKPLNPNDYNHILGSREIFHVFFVFFQVSTDEKSGKKHRKFNRTRKFDAKSRSMKFFKKLILNFIIFL